ncbi:hypothetical protein ES703_123761 [subsurface metagenome]
MIEGKRTVMRGIDKIRFDGLRFNSGNMSFALNMIIMDIIKRTPSFCGSFLFPFYSHVFVIQKKGCTLFCSGNPA